jgi:hypothetical protein
MPDYEVLVHHDESVHQIASVAEDDDSTSVNWMDEMFDAIWPEFRTNPENPPTSDVQKFFDILIASEESLYEHTTVSIKVSFMLGCEVWVHHGESVCQTASVAENNDSTSVDLERLIRIPRLVHTKIITEITYGLRFECYLYGWKAKRITFPIEMVSRPNTFLFHGNHRNNEVYRIYQGVALPYFGMMDYVSSSSQ